MIADHGKLPTIATIALIATMVAIIVGVDTAFLRHHFWERLGTNVAIVALFGMIYLLLARRN